MKKTCKVNKLIRSRMICKFKKGSTLNIGFTTSDPTLTTTKVTTGFDI